MKEITLTMERFMELIDVEKELFELKHQIFNSKDGDEQVLTQKPNK